MTPLSATVATYPIYMCTNMTSYMKRQVHNVSQCRQKRTVEPQPKVACTLLAKIGRVVSEICSRTGIQTGHSAPLSGRSNYLAPTGANAGDSIVFRRRGTDVQKGDVREWLKCPVPLRCTLARSAGCCCSCCCHHKRGSRSSQRV